MVSIVLLLGLASCSSVASSEASNDKFGTSVTVPITLAASAPLVTAQQQEQVASPEETPISAQGVSSSGDDEPVTPPTEIFDSPAPANPAPTPKQVTATTIEVAVEVEVAVEEAAKTFKAGRPTFVSDITAADFVVGWEHVGPMPFADAEASVDEITGSAVWTGHLADSIVVTLVASDPSSVLSEVYIQFPDETLSAASAWMQTLSATLSLTSGNDPSFGMGVILEAFEQGAATGQFAGAAEGIEFCMVQDVASDGSSLFGWTIRIVVSVDGAYCQP